MGTHREAGMDEADGGAHGDVARIERAMVSMRRSVTRRTLARLAGARADQGGGPAFEVLDVVEAAEEAGERVGVRAVADALRVDQPRASRLVTAAVAAGWVRRGADRTDGRRAPLAVTPAGRVALDEAHALRRAVVERVTADWSDGERAEFARLFTRFTEGFRELGRDG
ncbi:MarR family winged helix-turn-helix transcriptional regulator [Streptomyces sp. SPB4]|uniref:MarR family winged helix-turn-helix transcriptional regulator n=1 Tax=Streptomyces sp. SPB4 TaxID=2940553 RepID=UPI0024758DE7|nr:MarR family winged helix-turn-helix transcriptional regulator [Streptomyces sp. SPB4]MDH6543907.1 DNA-binding MarR family transcriptional regulator [Streptomyces sp. SPB4]